MGLATLATAHLAVVVLSLGGADARASVSNLGMLLAAVAAAVACGAATGAPTRGERRAWLLLATGCAAWAVGQVAWMVESLATGTPSYGGNVWSLSFSALPLCAFPALLVLVHRSASRRRRRPRWPLVTLDAVGLLGAVVVLAWGLVLRSAVAEGLSAVSALWVVADVAVATGVLVVLTAESGALSRPLRLIAAGLLAVCVGDLAYAGQALGGRYAPGGLVDVLFVGGLLLVGAGALLSGGRDEARRPLPQRLQRMLLLVPYTPVGLAVATVIAQLLLRGRVDEPVVVATAVLVVVVLVRQAATLIENADLIDGLAVREAELRQRSLTDALTGLGNRVQLLERLDEALTARVADPSLRVTVLYVDLDDFKLINDTHGHDSGDAVLVVVARRLGALAGEGDTVARLGGDEFGLLLVGRDDDEAVAARVLDTLTRPIVVGPRRFTVSASIGLVAAEGSGETSRTLLSHADIAMYVAKGAGRGRVSAVRGSDRAAAARQVRLRELVAQPRIEEFSVVYQPVVSLDDGRVRGVEALLRWTSAELGVVPPDVFIPLAESAGSVGMLGRFVLSTALADLARWGQQAPGTRLALGVNLSPLQLDEPGLVSAVRSGLAASGLTPDQLVLEVTEQALVDDMDRAVAAVAELRAAGVSVAIDDFGTGYSSFRYLDRFDADVLKIDRSFIGKLEHGARTRSLVRSVLDLCRELDVQTIAEGVETRAQLELLQALGCELGQGWLFSRALPAAEITELLHAGARFPVGRPEVPEPRTLAGPVVVGA